MKCLYNKVCQETSRRVTSSYSTSFTLGIKMLDRKLHDPIYAIYGFVRFADEIVDTFHGHDKELLLSEFKRDTFKAIERGISLNPILHSFQAVVNKYNIDHTLIETFLHSMRMDLEDRVYDQQMFEEYILGSAEVVGLMCLQIFVNGDKAAYESLKRPAMALGAAFQKVNFLRDIKADYEDLGRTYFPNVDMDLLDLKDKRKIEESIRLDFEEAIKGIARLPREARRGVYTAYKYYVKLYEKIKASPVELIRKQRIRIPNGIKFYLLVKSYFQSQTVS